MQRLWRILVWQAGNPPAPLPPVRIAALEQKSEVKVMTPKILPLLLLLLFCGTATAADFYVSPSGNDANNGTSLEFAWATITHAFRTLPENDTAWIVDGTYTETGSSISAIDSHTSVLNNSTAFRAYNGTPILNMAGGDIGVTLHNVENVTIDGLKIQNFGTYNIHFYYADNNTITNCTVYNSGWKNVHLQHSKNNTISNCVIDKAPFTGLYIDLDSDYTTVFNTSITNSVWWGIDTTADSDYLNITDCILTNNDCYGLCVHGCDHCTFKNNNLSNNLNGISLFQGSTYCIVEDNYATQNTEYGIEIWSSNHNTVRNNTFDMNSDWGIAVESCTNNTFSDNTVNNNTEYDYYAFSNAVDNIIENVTFSNNTFWLADSTSNWIIRYSENNLTEANTALNMTCYADNCTINLEGDTGFAINMTTMQTTIGLMSGSVEVGVDSSLIEIDYQNTTLNDVNFTNIDRPIMLKDSGVSTLMFSVKNNIHWCMKNLAYLINATANRKAVSADTWTTNSSLDIDFTFNDLYPSSNFDCKYGSASFTTNTSNSTGTLKFNKSSWLTSAWYPLELFMTTTPYRCGGVCAVDEGDIMMVYLDLNDTTVTHVRAEITKPNGATANHTMSDFLEDGATS
jgi:parallel beta-helix repeat protein